jgi:uncharacterized protein
MHHLRRLTLAGLLALASGGAPAQQPTVMVMGTGEATGVYYPVGLSVCRLLNAERQQHGIRCTAVPSEGSVENVEAIRAGDRELGLVQADVQNAAAAGSGPFAAPVESLRAVMSLHPEAMTLVARADAGIDAPGDLPGKRVGLGPPGSGQRALMELWMAELGWDEATFAEVADIGPNALRDALCDGAIDAFAFTVGHPAALIQDVTRTCPARLIEAAGPAVETLVAEHAFVSPATIPGGLYAANREPVETFGVRATLVADAAVPDEVVYALVRSTFERIEALRALNPALADLDPAAMATEGLTAPLHPGAARYYRERGWVG